MKTVGIVHYWDPNKINIDALIEIGKVLVEVIEIIIEASSQAGGDEESSAGGSAVDVG